MVTVLLSGLASILVVEIALRIAIRRGPYYVFAPNKKEQLVLDQETHPQLPSTVRILANEKGERGSAIPSSKRLYSGLVVGGSAVENFLLDQEVAWPQRLQSLLREEKRRTALGREAVHIGNIGRSGVDTSTLDEILKKVLVNYRSLDLIVIMVGASDVLRWLEIGAPVERGAKVMPVEECYGRHPEVRLGFKPKELALAEVFRRQLIKKLKCRENAARWFGRARKMRANAKVTIHDIPDYSPVVASVNRHFPSLLKRSIAKASNVIVVRQPWFDKDTYLPEEEALFWNGGVGRAFKEELTTYYSTKVIAGLMNIVDSEISRICDGYKVTQVDLRSVISSDTSSYVDQFHFTPKASETVASLLADLVVSINTDRP